MSNCIEIHSNRLELSSDVFNIPAFRDWFGKQKDRDETSATGFYWFLKSNTEIEENKVTIRVGRGFSSHTWRDLRWLVWTLNPFFIKSFSHTFQIADEMDGFDMVESIEVEWPYESQEKVLR
jgi:hypothetical protein